MGQVLSLYSVDPRCDRILFGTALVGRLLDVASSATGIPVDRLTGCGRGRDEVWTRWAVSIVSLERGRTLCQVGRKLNRDHSTILHGIRQGRKLADAEFLRLLDMLRGVAP